MTRLAICALLLSACGGNSGPTVLVANESTPAAVTVAPDGSAVFWLDDSDELNGATLRRYQLTGKPQPPDTIASDFGSPKALVTDGANVYWLSGDGKLRSTTVSGGAPAVLSTEPAGYTPFALALTNGALYWLSTQPANPDSTGTPTGAAVLVQFVPGAGATRKVVAQMPAFLDDSNPWLLAADGGNVYWVQSDGNVGMLDGSGKASFIAKQQGLLSAITASGGFAYWLQNINNSLGLIKKPLASLDAPSLVTVVPATVAMVTDGKFVYVAGGTTVAVSKVSLADNSLTTLMSDPNGAFGLALGPGSLFILSNNAGGEGRVLKVAR